MYPVRTRSLLCGSHCHVRIDAVARCSLSRAGERRGRLGARPLRRVGNHNFEPLALWDQTAMPQQRGPDCTFVTTSFTASGKGEPGGPFTETGTQTVLFGLIRRQRTVRICERCRRLSRKPRGILCPNFWDRARCGRQGHYRTQLSGKRLLRIEFLYGPDRWGTQHYSKHLRLHFGTESMRGYVLRAG